MAVHLKDRINNVKRELDRLSDNTQQTKKILKDEFSEPTIITETSSEVRNLQREVEKLESEYQQKKGELLNAGIQTAQNNLQPQITELQRENVNLKRDLTSLLYERDKLINQFQASNKEKDALISKLTLEVNNLKKELESTRLKFNSEIKKNLEEKDKQIDGFKRQIDADLGRIYQDILKGKNLSSEPIDIEIRLKNQIKLMQNLHRKLLTQIRSL